MSSLRWASMILLSLVFASGCKKTATTTEHQPIAPDQRVEQVRQTLTKQNPGVQVGPVVETLPSERLVAISGVAVDQFHKGDIITFIDVDMNVVDTGKVHVVTADQVHVRYDTPMPGHRGPKTGDLGVLVPPKH